MTLRENYPSRFAVASSELLRGGAIVYLAKKHISFYGFINNQGCRRANETGATLWRTKFLTSGRKILTPGSVANFMQIPAIKGPANHSAILNCTSVNNASKEKSRRKGGVMNHRSARL